MAAGASGDRSFQETPTWAIAVVCAVFVIISLLIEHGIHSLGKVVFNLVELCQWLCGLLRILVLDYWYIPTDHLAFLS
jgi:hypothetical protein